MEMRALTWVMRSTLGLGVLSVTLAGMAGAQTPEGVSPGATERFMEVEARCPTFSWTLVPGAEGYELVAYRLPEGMVPADLDLSYAEEVLFTRVAGAATSWTPDVVHRLAPGGAYIWFVRAVVGDEHEESAVADDWSQGRFFSVSAVPDAYEVQEALEVLRRYTASEGGRRGGSNATTSEQIVDLAQRRDVAVGRVPTVEGAKSVTTAKTAVKGHVSGSSGESYGLVGISDSAAGAGIAAANTNGGPDLVLDGSEDLLPDALLTESGIDRPWGTSQTFNIRNSGGGGMTLQVDGQAVGMISQIDPGSGLTGGGSSGVVSLGIATGAVTAAHLATNSVGSAEIQNDSVTYDDIDVDSVQRRVSSACGVRNAIRSISNAGGVTCEYDDFNVVSLSGPYSASVTNGGSNYAIWAAQTSTNMCFLTTVHLRDVDGSSEDAWCRVYVQGGLWTLEAYTETGDDADAWCTMYCLSWHGRTD